MIKKLIITLLFIAGIAIGLGFYLLNNEPFLKGQLHAILKNATGWSITVDGALDLDLGKEITLLATELSLSNPGWENQPIMAEAGRLQVTIDAGVLLGKKLVIENVELEDCKANVAKNGQNESNWALATGPEEETPGEKEEPETGIQEPPLQLNRLSVQNCRITHIAPQRDQPLVTGITTLSMTLQDDGNYLTSLNGMLDDISMELDGLAGPIRALWQGGRFDHEIKLQAGQVKLESSGTVADTKTLTGADILMTFSGPDIGIVIESLALPSFSTGAFNFSLEFDTTGTMTEVDIQGDLGSLEATVDGELDRLRHPTNGNLDLIASGPNLGALAEALGVAGLVTDPFEVQLRSSVKDRRTRIEPLVVRTKQDRVEIGGTVGAFPEFHHTDLKITAHSDNADRWMSARGIDYGPFGAVDSSISLSIDDSGIVTLDGGINQSQNQLEFTGSLGPDPERVQPDFTFTLTVPDLQTAGGLFHIKDLPAAPLSIAGGINKDESRLHLNDILADLKGNTFRTNGHINLGDNFRGSRLSIDSDIPSAANFAALFGVGDVPDQKLTLGALIEPSGSGMKFKVSDGQLGDMKIKVDGEIPDLDKPLLLDSDFDISLPSLALLNFLLPDNELPNLPFDANGHIRNADGMVQLKEGRLKLGSTEAEVEALFRPGKDLVGSELTLSARGEDLRELTNLPALESLPRDFGLSGKWARNEQGDQLENIEVNLGDTKLNLDGRADNLLDLSDFTARAQLDIADISELNTLLKRTFEPEALTLSASIAGSPEVFDLKDISLQTGETDLAGEIHIDRTAKPGISGQVSSNHLDLRPFVSDNAKPTDVTAMPDVTKAQDQPTPGSSKKVFDDTPVRALQESPVDLDLKVRVTQARLANIVLEDIALDILWRDRLFQLNPFQLSDQKGARLDGRLLIDGQDGMPDLTVNMNASDLRLGIVAAKNQDPETYPPVELHIDLHGSGHTKHDIARSLNGNIRAFWGAGLYAASGLNVIFSDFLTELLNMLNPFAKTTDYSSLECAVLAADVQSGVMQFDPILLHDEKITIVSTGKIDLDSEKIDLEFRTKPRKGFGVSAGVIINSLIKVGGTLSSPGVELDAGSAVVSGGTAVATAGLSLIAKSFADRFLSSKDPCGDARERLAEEDAKRRSDSAKP